MDVEECLSLNGIIIGIRIYVSQPLGFVDPKFLKKKRNHRQDSIYKESDREGYHLRTTVYVMISNFWFNKEGLDVMKFEQHAMKTRFQMVHGKNSPSFLDYRTASTSSETHKATGLTGEEAARCGYPSYSRKTKNFTSSSVKRKL
ncbi:hypothetical protein Tco_1168114 [Tanacetum coccineum]